MREPSRIAALVLLLAGATLAGRERALADGDDAPPPEVLHRVGAGSTGIEVERVQFLINEARAAAGESALAIDGKFGPTTRGAVRLFQKRERIPETAVVDSATWVKLEQFWPELPEPNGPDPDALADKEEPAPSKGLAALVASLFSFGSSDSKKPAAPAPAPPVSAPGMKLTAKELSMLARLIESEAGICSLENKTAVGAVVLHRARDGWAGGSVIGVIMEKNQFDGVRTPAFFRTPSADSVRAANAAVAGQDPSRGATYYYNPYISHPAWAKAMVETARIGTNATNTHRFMKPR